MPFRSISSKNSVPLKAARKEREKKRRRTVRMYYSHNGVQLNDENSNEGRRGSLFKMPSDVIMVYLSTRELYFN